MLSNMHPQLAKFFQYRLAQQELMKELGESGVALSMQQDLRALRGWYKLFGQRVGGPILDMAEVSNLVADTDERPIRLRRYRPTSRPWKLQPSSTSTAVAGAWVIWTRTIGSAVAWRMPRRPS